jgi:hypothetical protein
MPINDYPVDVRGYAIVVGLGLVHAGALMGTDQVHRCKVDVALLAPIAARSLRIVVHESHGHATVCVGNRKIGRNGRFATTTLTVND